MYPGPVASVKTINENKSYHLKTMVLWLIRSGKHGEFENRFLDEGRIYFYFLQFEEASIQTFHRSEQIKSATGNTGVFFGSRSLAATARLEVQKASPEEADILISGSPRNIPATDDR